jgi:hypothetical protein
MNRLTVVLALTAVLLAGPAEASAARAPKMFHGVMWDRAAVHASPEVQNAQWALMARSGVDSVRLVFSWAAAQPTALGPVDYTETDAKVEAATRQGIRLLPIVMYTPQWAKKYPGISSSPPKEASDYAAFVRRLVERYGAGGSFWADHPELRRRPLREWQIWNEPHFDIFWYVPGPGGWAPDYVNLLRQASRAIRAVDPGARVVLSGFADTSWKYLATALRAGAGRAFDVAAIHVFTHSPSFVVEAAEFAHEILRRYHVPRKPIWVTETTFPAGKGEITPPEDNWQRGWYTTNRGMARRLARVYALGAAATRRLRLQRIYWYTWASTYSGEDDLFEYSGLVRIAGDEFAPRPALQAYRRSARR